VQRRLTAILAADIVGYSRLMGEDETRTLATLTTFVNEMLEPAVRERDGQIIKRMGDGWFIEFTNASDAVTFATKVQTTLSEHESIRLRIGIHIGDVTIHDDDLYGSGVNIAARLEALAEPGQVLISDAAFSSLDQVSAAPFSGGQTHNLKNIPRPIQVWRWSFGDPAKAGRAGVATEIPSIAVLPFSNLSSDPEQEFFADGIVEDLIMALSRFAWLLVIARNSCFAYKGKSVQSSQVAEELGVRYIVEGSVRQSATRIRVTAQLIDATHDRNVWSQTYDRPTGDLFDIQDDISQSITGVMVPALSSAERDRCLRSTRPSLDAWEAYQKGLAHYYRPYSHDDHTAARELFDQSIALDPGFADAHAMIAMMGVYAINSGQSSFKGTRQEIKDEALLAAERAVQADDDNALAHVALGRANNVHGNTDLAIAECRTAVSLNPNLALAHHELGYVLSNAGHLKDAIPCHDKAIRLSPNDPSRWNFHLLKGMSLFGNGENSLSLTSFSEAARLRPKAFWPFLGLSANLFRLGQITEAADAIKEVLARNPTWTAKKMSDTFASFDGSHLNEWVDTVKQAGLPEE
jgi:TolB-like protein/class 3 adenylate cyclase